MGDGVKDDLSRERSHLSKLHVTKRFNQNADEKEFGRFAASKQSRQNRNSVYQFFFHQRGEACLGFDLKLLRGGDLRQMDTLPNSDCWKYHKKALALSWSESSAQGRSLRLSTLS
jgi:hypothetical protein